MPSRVYCLGAEREGSAAVARLCVNRRKLTVDRAAVTQVEGEAPRLVGGLYGVSVGGAFFGESMFSLPELGGTDASKVCLVHLVAHLRRRGYTLLDTQMWSWHLEQFGCEEVDRELFLPRLERAARKRSVQWGTFEALPTDADPEVQGPRLLPEA